MPQLPAARVAYNCLFSYYFFTFNYFLVEIYKFLYELSLSTVYKVYKEYFIHLRCNFNIRRLASIICN